MALAGVFAVIRPRNCPDDGAFLFVRTRTYRSRDRRSINWLWRAVAVFLRIALSGRMLWAAWA
jgi:hypothetical protein